MIFDSIMGIFKFSDIRHWGINKTFFLTKTDIFHVFLSKTVPKNAWEEATSNHSSPTKNPKIFVLKILASNGPG